MLRTILAAVLGYCFIGVLIAGTDQLYPLLVPGFSASSPPAWYFLASMATDTVYMLAGGWLCGLIARGDAVVRGRSLVGLIVLGEVMGVVSTVYLWNKAPHYYSFYLLIVYPLAVWLGAKWNPVKA